MSNNILDVSRMNRFIARATPRTISKIWQLTERINSCWLGVPSVKDIDKIQSRIYELNEFIDFDAVKRRLPYVLVEEEEYLQMGLVGFSVFFPELITVSEKFHEAFIYVQPGVEKAHAWLYPIALEARTNADLEALIYFKSQGESLVSSDEIRESWRCAICRVFEEYGHLRYWEDNIIEKARDRELSLPELTDLLNEVNRFQYFLRARDEEEDFIAATFFRTVEWFNLNEYDPWVNRYTQEVSQTYQSGIDPVHSGFTLFSFCRSDLLLRKASKFGLEALLHGICVGNVDVSKPWKRYCTEPDGNKRINRIVVDYIPIASVIAFAWKRIKPLNINLSIFDQALVLLFQTQLTSGGWPLTSNRTSGDILSTCLAMIALGVLKPEGYQRYLEKAKDWLLSQQNEVGCWYIEDGPAVMISILCLEAIKLAEGNNQVTFKIQENTSDISSCSAVMRRVSDGNYIIFCEGSSEGARNTNFDELCYKNIFSQEFPNAVFCSVGGCKDIEEKEKLLFDVIEKVNPYHTIIKLIDRDDRSLEEIKELKKQGITVLSLRELESYLLEDEIIEKLCWVCDQQEKTDEIKAIKVKALNESIARGNPTDDLKSAAGTFYTETRKVLRLTQCGNTKATFLRDAMAPLVKPETNTYKLLRKDVFGI